MLTETVRPALYEYMAAILQRNDCYSIQIGGTADHVHVAFDLGRTATPATLIRKLKASSSKWLKTKSPDLADFAWQRGYCCFSVSPRDVDRVRSYIRNQEKHHAARSFKDELRTLLDEAGVEYDEKYLWE